MSLQDEHPAVERIREREARDAMIAAEGQTSDGQSPDRPGVNTFRRLREKAAKADALERENRELRIDAAFRDAGLQSLSDRQRAALLAVHDGEIDPDAFRATAEGLAFVDPTQISADEQAAHQRAAEATAGAPSSEAYLETLDDVIGKARTPEELRSIVHNAGMLETQ